MISQVQRTFLILVLAANYAVRVPTLARKGWSGALVIGAAFALLALFLVLLLRSSAKGALALFAVAVLSLVFTMLRHFVLAGFYDVPVSALRTLLGFAVSLTAAYCSFDLWSKWSKPTPR